MFPSIKQYLSRQTDHPRPYAQNEDNISQDYRKPKNINDCLQYYRERECKGKDLQATLPLSSPSELSQTRILCLIHLRVLCFTGSYKKHLLQRLFRVLPYKAEQVPTLLLDM